MHPMNFMMPEGVLRVRSFIQELVQIDQKEGIICLQPHCVCATATMYMYVYVFLYLYMYDVPLG